LFVHVADIYYGLAAVWGFVGRLRGILGMKKNKMERNEFRVHFGA
jgi:hypothetical protein